MADKHWPYPGKTGGDMREIDKGMQSELDALERQKELEKEYPVKGYTRQPSHDKFWQAIKDSRAGKPLELSEDEFELFSAIQNLGVEKPEPPEDKVEAVRTKMICETRRVLNAWGRGDSQYRTKLHVNIISEKIVRHLLNEFSLLSPAPELTLMRDEDIYQAIMKGNESLPEKEFKERHILAKAIAQAQLQHDKETLGGKYG